MAFHFATTMCALTGAGKFKPYSEMRLLFLRLGPASSDEDRAHAFEELCRMTEPGMTSELSKSSVDR
jgi:hypothetical protein